MDSTTCRSLLSTAEVTLSKGNIVNSRRTDTGPLDLIGTTIIPLAEALEAFASGPPAEHYTQQSRKFEYQYQHLGVDRVRVWLDDSGLSDYAREFHERLIRFLVTLGKWERQCIGIAQTTNLEKFQAYLDTDDHGHLRLNQEYDELIDQAQQTANYLRDVATVVQAKAGGQADMGS